MKMEKRQFRIGELAKHLGVERFVIRFWEKEFGIKSYRSPGGQRFYQEEDLATFKKIKILLYDKGFTIAGAKQHLHQAYNENNQFLASAKTILDTSTKKIPDKIVKQLKQVRTQLNKLQELL